MKPVYLCRGWCGVALLVVFPLANGCAGSGVSKVSGQVLYNGKPLPGGFVTFRPGDPKQNSITAAIDEQGNYQAVLPVGEVKVCVDNRELQPRNPRDVVPPLVLPPGIVKKTGDAAKVDTPAPPAPSDAPDKPAGRYVRIPDKYYDVDQSGLQFMVQPGEQQQHDIVLSK